MNYFNQIEDYCENRLDASSNANFEQAMLEDERLKAAVSQYHDGKMLAEGLLEIDIMETIVQLKENEGSINTNTSNSDNIFTLKKMLIAASLIGVIIFAWWMIQPGNIDTNKLYAELYEEPIWPTERSNSSDILSSAANEYLGGNIESAKYLLLDSMEHKALGEFWLAEMYLKSGQIDSALHYLPTPTDLAAEKDRIYYLKTLIYIHKGEMDKARETAKHLSQVTYERLKERLR